jgi:hypothetical protein
LKKTSSVQVQTLNKQLAKVNKHQAVLQEPLNKSQAEKVFIEIGFRWLFVFYSG